MVLGAAKDYKFRCAGFQRACGEVRPENVVLGVDTLNATTN